LLHLRRIEVVGQPRLRIAGARLLVARDVADSRLRGAVLRIAIVTDANTPNIPPKLNDSSFKNIANFPHIIRMQSKIPSTSLINILRTRVFRYYGFAINTTKHYAFKVEFRIRICPVWKNAVIIINYASFFTHYKG